MVDTAALGPPTFEVLRFGPTPAPPDVAERLMIGEGALALLTSLRFHAGTHAMQLSTAYIPCTLVQETPVADPGQRPWDTDTSKPVETCDIIMPTSRYLLSYRIPVDWVGGYPSPKQPGQEGPEAPLKAPDRRKGGRDGPVA
jgi:hypothetical protein